MADSRIVPTTQGRGSAGNSVEEQTLMIRKRELDSPLPDSLKRVMERGEAVDERWQ